MESGAKVHSDQFRSAHTIADNMGDLPAVHYYLEKDLNGSFNFDIIVTMLSAFAQSQRKPAVNKNHIIAALAFQEAWYFGIKAAWPVYYYFKLKYKWGHDNYYGTLGGIDNTARRIAELIDMISYENRQYRLEKITSLNSTGGHWPFDPFRITKADGSQTLDRASHDLNYQLQPTGTYKCRWGLYLGGWRWFSYGDVSTCPYKATATYQESVCNSWRYWPLSCKAY